MKEILIFKSYACGKLRQTIFFFGLTRRQNSASSVVGLIFVTEMIDNWRAVKAIMPEKKTRGHRASAHAYPQMIK